jgi:hypothetical protein
MTKVIKQYASLSLWLLPTLIGSVGYANYLYLSEDPRRAQAKLIDDLSKGRVDPGDFTAKAQNYLAINVNQYSVLKDRLGGIREICATLVIQDPSLKEFSFRSIHDNGKVDWIIYIDKPTKKIDYLAFMLSRSGGAPAILPPYIPQGAQVLKPPTNFGCLDPLRPIDESEEQRDCQTWPAMCGKQNQ